MTPALNLVLLNTKRSDTLSEVHRRWIARVVPLCIAYDLHLTLANFGIDVSPTEFAKKIAPSTSIGKGGQRFIELAKRGRVQITQLPLPQNLGNTVICTSEPERSKSRNHNDIAKRIRSERIALIFGCDEHQNRDTRKIKSSSEHHFDITGKEIKLGLDTEIGAVTAILSELKKG